MEWSLGSKEEVTAIRKEEMRGKGKESETLYRKANIRKLLFGRMEQHCSVEIGSYSQSVFIFIFLVFVTRRGVRGSRCGNL